MFPTSVQPAARTVRVDGADVAIVVRESVRAGRLRLSVGPHRPPVLVVPKGVHDRQIDTFLATHRSWLERQLVRVGAIEGRPPALGLDRAGVVWELGQPVDVDWRPWLRATAVSSGAHLVVGGNTHAAASAVERWYRRRARHWLEDSAGAHATRLGLAYSSLAVRDQRSRWGSCSSRGTLSFSWRLVLAPRDVLEYVVVHELCHLREANHSRAFWRLVSSALPGWERQRVWLREHQYELHGYSPATALGLGAA